MTPRRSLAEKQLFIHLFYVASVGFSIGFSMSGLAAPAQQLDAPGILQRAEAAYYEARFSDAITLLAPLNATLRGQADRVPELVRTKAQLALAHIGLNELSQAKRLFSEIHMLDSKFSLDPSKFAPKVLSLFEEAKAGPDEPPRNASAAEPTYKQAVEAYNRGDLSEALTKIHEVLASDPQNPLATEYLSQISNRIRLSIAEVTLNWHSQFKAGDFVHAAESYRQLLSINLDGMATASLDELRSEYRNAVGEISKPWTAACATHDQSAMDRIRREANERLPDPAVAQDILDGINSCDAKPTPTRRTEIADKAESEAIGGCVENPSSVALLRLKRRVEPRLPAELKRTENIRVKVSVKIDEAGNTRVYGVYGGSMPVTKAVIAALDQWKFYPATYNDRPVCVDTELPVVVIR